MVTVTIFLVRVRMAVLDEAVTPQEMKSGLTSNPGLKKEIRPRWTSQRGPPSVPFVWWSPEHPKAIEEQEQTLFVCKQAVYPDSLNRD
jgi:hypothetical protein